MNFFHRHRYVMIFLTTSVIVSVSLVLAYTVRYEFHLPVDVRGRILELLPAIIIIKIFSMWVFGCFRGWWRYVSIHDLQQIVKACLFGSALFSTYAVFVYHLEMIPRSVLLLDGIFCFLLIGGTRFAIRVLRENSQLTLKKSNTQKSSTLIVGAGQAGQMIAREINTNSSLNYYIVGFIDDDPAKKNAQFQGVKVIGSQNDIKNLVKLHDVDEIIIAIPSATSRQVRAIVERCHQLKVRFKILPGVGELIDGRVSVQQIRNVDLKDLLGRDSIHLDYAQIHNYIENKRVLVTGAGGSIGSEICRQVASFKPSKLILFENAETPLFEIEKELLGNCYDFPIVPVIGDIRNRSRVAGVFDQQLPQVIFHAAAYKHVPMMERNPAEAVNNNVQGTRILADAADYCKVETFVMVSTDKAVNPTNIMGTTKRVAEMYVQSLNQRSRTNFVTTRFGNVLGSNGSVIPIFKEQIAKGGPVTVTHPDVTRFFMTIPEATQLVLQAGSMGKGGEIYLFDMGEPVNILSLAEELIRLSGLEPNVDIDIVFTGLRPGEKLFEELLLKEEGVLPTSHQQICVAQAFVQEHEQLVKKIEALVVDAKNINHDGVKEKLRQLVPEYTPALNPQKAKVIPLAQQVVHQ